VQHDKHGTADEQHVGRNPNWDGRWTWGVALWRRGGYLAGPCTGLRVSDNSRSMHRGETNLAPAFKVKPSRNAHSSRGRGCQGIPRRNKGLDFARFGVHNLVNILMCMLIVRTQYGFASSPGDFGVKCQSQPNPLHLNPTGSAAYVRIGRHQTHYVYPACFQCVTSEKAAIFSKRLARCEFSAPETGLQRQAKPFGSNIVKSIC
jgi:hypothetical protein